MAIRSMTIFTEEMKAGNIAIFIPQKGQCDLCCELEKVSVKKTIKNTGPEKRQLKPKKIKNQKLAINLMNQGFMCECT